MDKPNNYVFELYHYLLNLRDTLEFCLDREHSIAKYEARKAVITNGIKPTYAVGNFLENNADKGAEIKQKIETFIEDIYGDDSTVLVKTPTDIRVDHTQHIRIFEYVVGLQETIRDMLHAYMRFVSTSKDCKGLNKDLATLVGVDEILSRMIISMLLFSEYEKSFIEFNKLMNESKGQPTPQSNFIVQNELSKLSGLIRFSRTHAKCTDNRTLDILDEGIKLLDMTQGRRERENNKSFKDYFQELNKKTTEHLGAAERQWKPLFDKIIEDVRNSATQNVAKEEPQA